MPPKKVATTGAKPAAKGTGTKTTAAKPAASKGATGGAKAPAKAEPKKEEAKPAVIKKVVNPVDIPLKQIAALVAYSGETGEEYKASGRWLFVIDRAGNAGTFLKYRDVNYVQIGGPVEVSPETLRMALLGSLRFGKPTILDISETDQEKIMDLVKTRHNEIKAGTWENIQDRSIFEEDKYKALVRTTDSSEYHDTYSFRTQDYQLIILTNTDPPSSVMEDYFPVNIV